MKTKSSLVMTSDFFRSKNISNNLIIGIISMVPIFSAQDLYAIDNLNFNGSSLPAMSLDASKDTGLDKIFILYDLNGVNITFNSNSDNVRCMQYGNLGGGFAEEVSNASVNGRTCTLESPQGNMGYIIYDGDESYAFWLVDYSKYEFSINYVGISSQECDTAELDVKCDATPIYYYSINGRQFTLDREIYVEYNSLVWDEDNMNFKQEYLTKSLASISDKITISPPPFCNTYFTISGDRFLRFWDMTDSFESGLYSTNAVNCQTEAIQDDTDSDDASNRIDTDVDGMGGSAPCEISFNAYVTDAVVHNEWQMANDEDFEDITYRINDQNLTYTFTKEGTTYVRYIGSNSDGSCETYGDVYTVSIGTSELLIPNAFSPNDDGVNDVWKVSYRSLVDFECWIFDRHGHQIYHYKDPAGGWDGKHNGKAVKSGVYYYVIQATGSDGKKYKKSGDINIIKYNGSSSSSSSSDY